MILVPRVVPNIHPSMAKNAVVVERHLGTFAPTAMFDRSGVHSTFAALNAAHTSVYQSVHAAASRKQNLSVAVHLVRLDKKLRRKVLTKVDTSGRVVAATSLGGNKQIKKKVVTVRDVKKPKKIKK